MTALNTRLHRPALLALGAVVAGHWGEHLVQAWQIWVQHWPRPQALGLLGLAYPWLVRSEQLHYWVAAVMLVGLLALRRGFRGQARLVWDAALALHVWHHAEHLLLLGQVVVGATLLGRVEPTSVLQLTFPRPELHLVYNAVVTVPMAIAVYLHMRRGQPAGAAAGCACASPLWPRRGFPFGGSPLPPNPPESTPSLAAGGGERP